MPKKKPKDNVVGYSDDVADLMLYLNKNNKAHFLSLFITIMAYKDINNMISRGVILENAKTKNDKANLDGFIQILEHFGYATFNEETDTLVLNTDHFI